MSRYHSSITLPAYDSSRNGLIIDLNLTVSTSSEFSIYSIGNIAQALQYNFERIIEIMSSIKKSWECLSTYSYILKSMENNFVVKDSKSSSMGIAIMLLNIYRQIQNKPQIDKLTGTGILRADGGFDSANLELEKLNAVYAKNSSLNFLTALNCGHLYELEEIMH